jgi:hypothetical protein
MSGMAPTSFTHTVVDIVGITLRGCDFIGKCQNLALVNKDLRREKRHFANKITASPRDALA